MPSALIEKGGPVVLRGAGGGALVVSIVAGLVGGCGGGPKSDEDQIRDVATSFSHAFRDGDYAKACNYMTSDAKEDLAKAGVFLGGNISCDSVLKAVKGQMDAADKKQLENAKVRSIKVTGDT